LVIIKRDKMVRFKGRSHARRGKTIGGRDAAAGDRAEPIAKLFELLAGGASYRLIARVLCVPAGTVCRRARRIGARLHDPLVVALLEERCPLAPEIRQMGIEHFLAARSARQIAEMHRMSPGQVRSALEFVRGWHNGITQGWRWGRGA
jgi:hypothetical protein